MPEIGARLAVKGFGFIWVIVFEEGFVFKTLFGPFFAQY